MTEAELKNELVWQNDELVRHITAAGQTDSAETFFRRLSQVADGLMLVCRMWRAAGYGYKTNDVVNRVVDCIEGRIAAWERHPAKTQRAKRLLAEFEIIRKQAWLQPE